MTTNHWQRELLDLLRNSATPPTVAVIAGKDEGLTDQEIAQRWGELGGSLERCSVRNVVERWKDIDDVMNRVVSPDPRTAHDCAFTLTQALHSPQATPQFLESGEAYYKALYAVNPRIPADWRRWVVRPKYRGTRVTSSCQWCGNEFEGNPKARYCSVACRQASYRDRLVGLPPWERPERWKVADVVQRLAELEERVRQLEQSCGGSS